MTTDLLSIAAAAVAAMAGLERIVGDRREEVTVDWEFYPAYTGAIAGLYAMGSTTTTARVEP